MALNDPDDSSDDWGWPSADQPVEPEETGSTGPTCLMRLVRVIAPLLIVALVMSVVAPSLDRQSIVHLLGFLRISEELQPGDPNAISARLVCDDVADGDAEEIKRAFTLVLRTAEGARLYRVLGANRACVTVAALPYNGGYATARRSFGGTWTARITLDADLVRSGETDVVAASLVHEATHIDRAISLQDCSFQDACTTLPNGVRVEEEVAAHGTEAEWWMAVYGDDGKRFAFGRDYGENRLLDAYRDGPAAFRSYVIDLRDDPRDGTGVPGADPAPGAAPSFSTGHVARVARG